MQRQPKGPLGAESRRDSTKKKKAVGKQELAMR